MSLVVLKNQATSQVPKTENLVLILDVPLVDFMHKDKANNKYVQYRHIQVQLTSCIEKDKANNRYVQY